VCAQCVFVCVLSVNVIRKNEPEIAYLADEIAVFSGKHQHILVLEIAVHNAFRNKVAHAFHNVSHTAHNLRPCGFKSFSFFDAHTGDLHSDVLYLVEQRAILSQLTQDAHTLV